MTDGVIKPGQHWVAKDPERLKSNGQIRVIKIVEDRVIVERYYIHGNKPHFKKDRLTIKGLRKLYKLQHEQETLL